MSKKITRRQYLSFKALIAGTPTLMLKEAVSTTALAHPEWDMSEEKTWEEWERGE